MRIGIFGGTFNPIHIGHCILANYICQNDFVDEVWFVVSPQNPLKEKQDKTYDIHKLNMVNLAIDGCNKIKVCDIEYRLPRPSYSISTLRALQREYPEYQFKIIIGADNWQNFNKWKDFQTIIDDYGVIVYPRLGYNIQTTSMTNVQFAQAPIIDISSTLIRNEILCGSDFRFLVPEKVYNYIKVNKLYGYTK